MSRASLLALLLAARMASAGMAEHAHRETVAGIDVVTFKTNVSDVVTLVGALPAGDAMAEPGNIAVPTLAGMMLDRGTKTLDKFAIADKLNSVGAEIGFEVGSQALEMHAKCLKKDLPLVISLLAAELRTPALSGAEFAKAKEQFIGGLQASMQNSTARAREAFGRGVFPAGHPNRPHTANEYLTAAKAATLEEVKAFVATNYGPAHMILVMAGDVSDDAAAAEVAKSFAGWTGGRDYLRPAASPAASQQAATGRDVSVPLADKPSVSVLLGQADGLKYRDDDALALRMGTAVLGRGFTGRLMSTVRDKEGLTYHIDAGVADDSIADGDWEISASFAPALLDKGIVSMRRELVRWWQDGVTEQELAARKQGLVGSYLVGLSTTAGVAATILIDLQRGYDLSWLDAYPEELRALTRERVNAAIRKHLDPQTMLLVKAGSVPP